MLKLRPQTNVNKTSYISDSIDERSVFIISIVTEGSKEEQIYIKGYYDLLRHQGMNNMNIEWINEDIIDKKKEEKASHPLRRLELMKERLSRINPYYKDYPDEAWLVCDRDDYSFSQKQYDTLLEECKRENIQVVISNPAFQLWLLLHFDSWLSDRIFEDDLSSKDILKIIEHQLKRRVIGYSHGKLNMIRFISKIQIAQQNSKKYCTNIQDLKQEIGTNFGLLIDSIIKHNK
ncbi:RloB domain-containing protein [Bacteroides fragilis]|mgnify:FL=1|jgi:hypothetical protein|uniref:RloB family protein n=1 Tax=Bacteroides fragilis TaxID=817 RepID=UPI000EFB8EA4|nr:RloB family protein [Bacteroides fragilis]RGQ92932.1 RloB domain-containing protein [Bacteroides fragilis]